MRLRDIYKDSESCKISFEVFPPKGGEIQYPELYQELKVLKKYNPVLVSLTWGAGGNNNNSMELVKALRHELDLNVMAHFTCICNSKENVESHIKEIETLVGVAGYPEGHIEAVDLDTDIANLKRKVDAGAEAVFTQLFFENDKFYRYVDKVRSAGITLPIIPGIMPVISLKQVLRMTSMAKISVPSAMMSKLEKYQNNPDDMKKLGIDIASEMCDDLIRNGAQGLHFYTLNKSYSTVKILDNVLNNSAIV